MKSLEQLSEQLLGVRVSAANTTLWNIGATITERARLALNDAIAVYQFPVTEQFSSVILDDSSFIAVLPPNIENILDVRAVSQSGWDRWPLFHYRHVPTPMTNLLYLEDESYITDVSGCRALEITFEGCLAELPPSGILGAVLNSNELNAIGVTGFTPIATWKPSGYLEISDPSGTTDGREVVHYESVTSVGFEDLLRGVEGEQITWPRGSRISAVLEAPPQAVPVIMAAAEANLYAYWVSHRAQYDQFTSAAGIQSMDIKDVLGVVRAGEDRADRRYGKLKQSPPPTRIKTRRRPW